MPYVGLDLNLKMNEYCQRFYVHILFYKYIHILIKFNLKMYTLLKKTQFSIFKVRFHSEELSTFKSDI